MNEIINTLSILIVVLSVIAFFIGLIISIFSVEKRKLGVQILVTSVIAFVIGFSTCVATFSMGEMH